MTISSVGCASIKLKPQEKQAETGTYLRLFQSEMKLRNVTVTAPRNFRIYITENLYNKYNEVVGMCHIKSDRVFVYIDKELWYDKLDSLGREILLFHELGHCLMGLPHDMRSFRSGQPYNLMYPTLFDPTRYATSRNQYLNELAADWKRLYGGFNFDKLEDFLDNILGGKKTLTYIYKTSPEFRKRYNID
jgi:hypothetical protein